MTDVLGFQCQICGEEFPDDLPIICAHCHAAICSVCEFSQGEDGQGHEQAEHGNELRFDRRRVYDYEGEDEF